MKKILIVDDDRLIGITFKKLFRQKNYQVKHVTDGKRAIYEIENYSPDLILLDFQLPDMNGFQILKRVKQINDSIIVIMITSFGEIKKAVTAIKLGAYDFFTKPFDSEEIYRVVENALKNADVKTAYSNEVLDMLANSQSLHKIFKLIDKIAKTDISVFIEGETGSGKEVFSRLIHSKSARKEKPFITVDCGAIPESLFESELWGHKKGSFTGAISDKKGKFEQANGGTLFLDEINSLPLNLQPKLLRVLQEKEIQRLGDEEPRKIDVRIIAATNLNIEQEIKNGKFREDLFYRIHEFKINLPPLRERKDDIPILAKYFLKEISKQYDAETKEFSESAIKKLIDYYWPGNIREMKNVIKSAVLLSNSQTIEDQHIILRNLHNDTNEEIEPESFLLEHFTLNAEKKIIRKALQKTNGNKTEAAKLLGISRSQFYKKLEKLQLDK